MSNHHPDTRRSAGNSGITRVAPSPTGTLHLGNARRDPHPCSADGAAAHLQTCRAAGVQPQRVIGLLAAWCGVGDAAAVQPISTTDFRPAFWPDMLPRTPVRFTKDQHAWLNGD